MTNARLQGLQRPPGSGRHCHRRQRKPVKTQKDLFEALDGCSVGQRISVEINRRGELLTVDVVLAERDRDSM